MGRTKNDGRGRMGGRAKGTPNKAKTGVNGWVSRMRRRTRPHIEQTLTAQDVNDGGAYTRLLPALVIAEAVNGLTATVREIAQAAGLNLNTEQAGAAAPQE